LTYDICLLALSDIRTDARTINIAQALTNTGKSVCIVAPDWSDGATFEGIETVYIPVRTSGRLRNKWVEFTAQIRKQCEDIQAKSFWAEDLWSLKAASILSRRQRATLLYDSREIYSALGPLHKRPVMQALIAAMERHYAKYADMIIVSGELDAEYIRQHLKRNDKPRVVMNVPPYSEPGRSQKLREHFSISAQDPVIVYQGILLKGRGIERMIHALRLMPDLQFCIIGDGPDRAGMLLLAESCGVIKQVHFLGSVPNTELLAWTASADIGLCFVEAISFSYKLALPNKLFEYAMARIPALVSDLPAMRRILDECPFGEIISAQSSSEEIIKAVKNILHRKQQYVDQTDAVARRYNREAQEDIISEIYQELQFRRVL
jgi:glycosyltransferase involved in cell wall biosynthesis